LGAPVKILFILNPASGGGRGKSLLAPLKKRIKTLGLSAEIALSAHPQEARDIALGAQKKGAELFVACGGDGTIHSLLPILVNRPVALGVIPIGTANDLARNWLIPFTLGRALELLVKGRPKSVDVIQTQSGEFIAGAAGIGFDAAVVDQAERLRKVVKGLLPFSIAILSEFSRYTPTCVSLKAGDWIYEGPAWQVLLTKISRYAYILKITSPIKADNGLMEICLIPEIPKIRVLRALPRLPFLGLRKLPGALSHTAPQLEIESSPPVPIHGDGDLIGQTPEVFRVIPRALRVMMPVHPPARFRLRIGKNQILPLRLLKNK